MGYEAIAVVLIILPSLAYQLLSIFAVRGYFSEIIPPAASQPPITILKPLKGADSGLYENLASFCCQRYPQFQIVFAVASSDDPAVATVRQLMRRFPEIDIALVIDNSIHGVNLKVGNLINGYSYVKYDIIAVSDSDVRVGNCYLSRLADYFADSNVGLVTSLYRSSSDGSLAGSLEGLGFSTELLPNVVVARRLEGMTFALGASMACRKGALEQIGGFRALADYLADDYQLGNRIARAGWKVELSPEFVSCSSGSEPLHAVLSRQLRWCRTMRASRPGGYFASIIKEPLPAIVLLICIFGTEKFALLSSGLLYSLRVCCATIFSRVYARDALMPRNLWLLPLRDLTSIICWLLAFCGNRVSWRGDRFRIVRGGKIEPV